MDCEQLIGLALKPTFLARGAIRRTSRLWSRLNVLFGRIVSVHPARAAATL